MIKSKLLVKQFKLHVYWNTLQNKYWIKNKQQWMQYRQKFGYIQISEFRQIHRMIIIQLLQRKVPISFYIDIL